MTRACLLALVASIGVASAQPSPEDVQRAAELYDKGKRHFDIAEYAAAIEAWKDAYLLSSEPLLLFNIAQAHRLAGDCAQANRFYLNYKRAQPKPPNKAELESAMAKCAGVEPATGDTTTPPPTPTEPPPPAEPPPAEPPPAEPPPATTAAPTMPPATAPAEPVDTGDDTDPGRTFKLAGIATAAAGVVAGGIGIYYALDASSKADEIAGQKTGTVWDPKLDAIEADGKSAERRARILGVVGVAAIVTGGALWWYGRSRSSAVRVDVAVTPEHSEVSLTCAF